jgi:hypothetical protein
MENVQVFKTNEISFFPLFVRSIVLMDPDTPTQLKETQLNHE